MLPKVAVVVLHSQSNKIKCWKCSHETSPSVFCETCHSILDYRADISLSYFDVLQIKETLLLNEDELRAKFYELSKKLHPDQFANSPHPAPQYALRWTTALNRAYQTLKKREERTQYLIEKYLAPSSSAAKAVIPTELAEAYFEVQDLLSEGQIEPIIKFKKELEKQLKESEKAWEPLAKAFDEAPNKTQVAELLRRHENRDKYIHSMLTDIERKVKS